MPHEEGHENPIMNQNPDIGVGISFPLQNGNSGFFEQTMTTMDAVKANIKNLLLTMKGERPMQPDFGTDLFTSIFEPMQDGGEIEENCSTAIYEAMAEWLPYVEIKELDFSSTDEEKDRNIFRITLVFGLNTEYGDEWDELTFTVEGNSGG